MDGCDSAGHSNYREMSQAHAFLVECWDTIYCHVSIIVGLCVWITEYNRRLRSWWFSFLYFLVVFWCIGHTRWNPYGLQVEHHGDDLHGDKHRTFSS